MSEADFQRRVIETARLYGWRVCHYQDSTLKSGRYGTAVQGDAGGQDLILARDGVVILAELKSDRGRLQPEQKRWEAAVGAHARVWRPRDWDVVLAELSAGRDHPLSAAEQSGCACPMCPAVGS